MNKLHKPAQNRLLAALPARDLERLSPDLELTRLSFGDIVHDNGGEWVYFPTTAKLSLSCTLNDEPLVTVVGNGGALGISQLFVGRLRIDGAVVDSTGYAFRLHSRVVRQELNCSGSLLRLLLHYVRDFTAQVQRDAASTPVQLPVQAETLASGAKRNGWFGFPN